MEDSDQTQKNAAYHGGVDPLCQLQRQMFWLDFNRPIRYLCSDAHRARTAQQTCIPGEPCSTQAHLQTSPLPVFLTPSIAWQEQCCALHPVHQRFFFWTMYSELFSRCSPAVDCSSEEVCSWCSPPPFCTVLQSALSPGCSWQPPWYSIHCYQGKEAFVVISKICNDGGG